MKKIFILSILFFTLLECYAQKIRFNDTTNVWVSCSSDPFDQKVDQYGNVLKASTSYRITGDT